MLRSQLNTIAREQLVDLLLKSTAELMTAIRKRDPVEIAEKHEFVQQIHEVFLDFEIKQKAVEHPSNRSRA